MATMVRLTQEQIGELFAEADKMEHALKDLHEELSMQDTPEETLARFEKLHDRFTSIIGFLRRQRELGT